MRHEISLRSVFSLIAIGFGLILLSRIWTIVLLLVVAMILAGTLAPIVSWLEQHRVRRPIGLGLVLLGLLGGLFGLGALVIPALAAQVADVAERGPALRDQLAVTLDGIPVFAGAAEAVRTGQPSTLLSSVGNQLVGYAGIAAQAIIYGLLTVVLAFYLLADYERVQGFFFALLPRHYHLRTARVLLDMGTVVGGYVRGQALISLFIGLVTFVVLLIAGVPNALALAVFAAAVDLIPLAGASLAVIPSSLVAFSRGPVVGVSVFAALFLYNQVESHILIPRVHGKTLRLSPLAVVVSLLIGGQLLGIVGALLALPLAAGLRVLVEDLRIELPGEQTSEAALRAADERDEALYAEQTQGASALEAAVVATTLAEQRQGEELATTGQLEIPIEERRTGTDGLPDNATPAALPNPAR